MLYPVTNRPLILAKAWLCISLTDAISGLICGRALSDALRHARFTQPAQRVDADDLLKPDREAVTPTRAHWGWRDGAWRDGG